MPKENMSMRESLSALVMKPRSVQRTHQKVDCEDGSSEGATRTVSESIEIDKKEKDNAGNP